ncbi:hypothetical protein SeMB42_g01531 [Synchytrium endobioticum]|nr:hypothetical protein SeMB42_g01524 [Synchytrium endobioticum]TPX52281.1 hypothetical protein SeMB42_g01528 [Synchytrium endobioticum]TPX52285.1 hypothetical protein SeMB42_g01531 [Synchytrium endobioticum]
MWDEFLPCADGIVFVLNIQDEQRVCVARDELHSLFASHDGPVRTHIPVLVLANGTPEALAAASARRIDYGALMELDCLDGCVAHVFMCDGVGGRGVMDGFAWLFACMAGGGPAGRALAKR